MRFYMFKLLQSFILLILVSLLLIVKVTADDGVVTESKWWLRMAQEAKKSGYFLIATHDAQKWYKQSQPFVVIDVRPDYEYEDGHLKNALNVVFDLGARNKISKIKKKAFVKALGGDKTIKILIYCRSYS
jgi:predicted sulfurtransferase